MLEFNAGKLGASILIFMHDEKNKFCVSDVSYPNPASLWTPLHAAVFQEHIKVLIQFILFDQPLNNTSDGKVLIP